MFRIARIDAFAIAVPLATPAKLAGITIAACDNLIVRIADDGGRVGWGAAPDGPGLGIAVDENKLARFRVA